MVVVASLCFGCASPLICLEYSTERVVAPNYTISVFRDGAFSVHLSGVDGLKGYRGKATQEDVVSLLNAFERSGFLSMEPTYSQGYSDLPLVRLSLDGYVVEYSWLGGTMEEMLEVDANAPLDDYYSFVLLESLRGQIEKLVNLSKGLSFL